MDIEMIADYACACGEGPLWHEPQQRVYWVDIPPGRLFRYTPATGDHEQLLAGEAIGGFTIQADGALLLFMARGRVARWADGQVTTLIDDIADERESRFNDVIADPAGRVFCGTMPTPDRPGRLYRLDTDGRLTRVLEGITCSNGMGFTPDGRGMYYTDSFKQEIYLFDYHEATGELANQRVFARVPAEEGIPDGMTVDAEGFVWSARWDGGCVVRHAPDGSVDRRIEVPARKASSVIFAGPDYADLYITTAGGDRKDEDGPMAGALLRCRPGVCGVAEFPSKVML